MGLKPFLKAGDIVAGNSKLNLGLVATIFNANPGLAEMTVEETEELGDDFAALDQLEEDAGDTREERSFRMWINSLNIQGLHVEKDLFSELSDTGLPVLQVMDCLQPGVVPWKKTHAKPKSRIHVSTVN